jgi:hypothetical protein
MHLWAIPVSWVIVPANQKGAWMPHVQRMLRWLAGSVAADHAAAGRRIG